jgi:hypothetical protein
VFTYSAVVPYLFLSLRRAYGQSAGRTLAKLSLICFVTFLVDNAVSFVALMLALWLV